MDVYSSANSIGGDVVPRTLAGWLARGFSVRKAGADKAWMDILQYCGDSSFYLDKGGKLFGLAEKAVDLDPCFVYVYSFSCSMLMWQCNRPNEAVELLNRGIRNNPGDKWLKLYLAAFTYKRLNDLGSQVKVLEELVNLPSPPPMLYRILANVYSKQGKFKQAAKLWVFIADYSPDGADREWARGKMAKFGVKRAP
jgi:tetratricopeptide (TPR) repeat protein